MCNILCFQYTQETVGIRGEKAGLWTRLKQRWRKHGVVEIDESHHRFGVLSCIKEAIKDVVVSHPELGPKVSSLKVH